MSDGMTDGYRMTEDHHDMEEYYRSLIKFLVEPNEASKQAAIKAAVHADYLWSRWTDWGERQTQAALKIEALASRADKPAWAAALLDAKDYLGAREWAALQKCSPWPDKEIAFQEDWPDGRRVVTLVARPRTADIEYVKVPSDKL